MSGGIKHDTGKPRLDLLPPEAIRAGYSAKTADTNGPKLYRKISVFEAIQKAMVKREKEAGQ